MQTGNLFVQMLRQEVYFVFVALFLLPVFQKIELRQRLIRERAGHHERRVASCTAQIQKTARREHNDTMAIREDKTINAILDVLGLDTGEFLKTLHVNLVVEMPNVSHNGVVLHFGHMFNLDDVEIASCGHKDVNLVDHGLELGHLEALHARLQGTDRINLCNQYTGTSTAERKGTALADIIK